MSKVDKLIFGNTKFLVFAIIRKTEKKKPIRNEAKNARSIALKRAINKRGTKHKIASYVYYAYFP